MKARRSRWWIFWSLALGAALAWLFSVASDPHWSGAALALVATGILAALLYESATLHISERLKAVPEGRWASCPRCENCGDAVRKLYHLHKFPRGGKEWRDTGRYTCVPCGLVGPGGSWSEFAQLDTPLTAAIGDPDP